MLTHRLVATELWILEKKTFSLAKQFTHCCKFSDHRHCFEPRRFTNFEMEEQITNASRGQAPSVKVCAGCGDKIIDRFLLFALDQYWHVNCLKCSCCEARLGEIGTSCYSKGGMILCKTDYVRLYGTSGACAVCAKLIPATELVMKVLGKVYHLHCFTCTTCHNQLVSGDRFHVVNGRLFCENDDPNLLKQIHAAKQTVC